MPIEDKLCEDLERVLKQVRKLPRKSVREKILWETIQWCSKALGITISGKDEV